MEIKIRVNLDSCNGQSAAETIPPSAKKAKRIPKIFDGKYYSVKSDIEGNIEAICTACEEVKRGNYLSTGNFISHYKLKHHDQLQNLKEYTKETVKRRESDQPTLNEVLTATPDKVCL